MGSWNLVDGGSDRSYFLTDRGHTPLRLGRRVRVGLAALLVSMEEAGVPVAYTDGLREIYLTHLRGGRDGDYSDGVIRVSCSPQVQLARTLTHELAHHVDEAEDISGGAAVRSEWGSRPDLGGIDAYALTDPAEFVAVGFEEYYFGKRTRLRRRLPRLFRAVSEAHSKYSRR